MLSALTTLLTLLPLASTNPLTPRATTTPTLYLAGDSTMALQTTNIQGWGVYLPYSLTIPVLNRAVSGRSARSYSVENRFTTLTALLAPSDLVIIEFGHNDGGSLHPTDNGRTDCPGAGNETCTSTYDGKTVTVLTYPAYLYDAGKAMIAKGAKVIISSPTPDNPWDSGTFSYAPSRFTGYAQSVAEKLGDSAVFVDHGSYVAALFKTLGKERVDGMYPNDHTHTDAEGADLVAGAFVKAVLCAGKADFLGVYVKNETSAVTGTCL